MDGIANHKLVLLSADPMAEFRRQAEEARRLTEEATILLDSVCRPTGGRVVPYLVGEEGPELFVPRQRGKIEVLDK